MVRGVFTSTSGMTAQEKRLDLLGNNIANVGTDGYKRSDVSLSTFENELAYRTTDLEGIGGVSEGVRAGGVTTDFSPGDLKPTGIATDLALSGPGFFAVENGAGGVKYTRDGDFTLDDGGFLALPSGERLLGEDGRPIDARGGNLAVSADGTVTAGGTFRGKLGLFDGTAAPRRDGFYDLTGGQPAAATVRQGYVEGSNADMVGDMTGMMAATRAFQSCQQAYQVSSDTLERLVSSVGTLKG